MSGGRVTRRGICVAVALGLIFAGQASAATQLGLDFTPEQGGTLCTGGYSHFPLANNTTPEPYQVPTPGVITSWSFTTGRHAFTNFKFKVVRFTDNVGLTVAQDTATLPANQRTTNTVRIAVSTGDRIGIFVPSTGECLLKSTGATKHFIQSDTQPGQSNTYVATADNHIYPVSARLEADADNDGFGDESQDKCPTDASTQESCPAGDGGIPPPGGGTPPGGAADTTKPTLGGLSFTTTVFRAATSGGAFSAQKKGPIGTKVSFSLSEPSAVRFTVQRKTKGRRVGGKCAKLKRSNRTKTKCTRWTAVKGSFTVAGTAGTSTFTFRGRMGGKSLKPGSYRLNGTATDPANNASVPKTKGFKIVK